MPTIQAVSSGCIGEFFTVAQTSLSLTDGPFAELVAWILHCLGYLFLSLLFQRFQFTLGFRRFINLLASGLFLLALT